MPRSVTSFETLPDACLQAVIAEADRADNRDKLARYRPYQKQLDFHQAGAAHRERLFMAGNQLGKTWAGGMEWAMHLTGRYPEWWCGLRFDRPVRFWAAGKTAESTRDTVQKILLGEPDIPAARGTGTIPGDALVNTTAGRSVAHALNSFRVKHVSGGVSTCQFKTYDQGREKWQGPTLDGVWFDEEPPLEIYTEGLTRTNVALGPVIVTFTPLLGMSAVVRLFLSEKDTKDLR